MKRFESWGVVALTGGFFASVFVLIGGIGGGRHSSHTVLFHAAAGLFIGAIAAPELQPKAFRFPAIWQASFGGVAGVTLAASMETSLEALVAGAMIGALLGFLAPYWNNHIDVP